MLLYKKYKPQKLEDIKHNSKSIRVLETLKENMNHLLIYGLNGSGKNSIIYCYLNHIYNNDNLIYDTKPITIELKLNNTKIEFPIISSNYHFEINCQDFNDKRLVNHFIKTIATTNNIYNNRNKLIIIKHIEELTIEYQWMLRRTIEIIYNTCKIIFITNHISKLDNSILSRCICLRIESPTNNEIYTILKDIIDNEELKINETKLNSIIKISKRNLNTALVLLETSQDIKPLLYYKKPFETILNKINKFVQIEELIDIRRDLHNLLLYNLDVNDFMSYLLDYYISINLELEKKHLIIEAINKINNSITTGYKKLYHLESIISKIILILNTPNTEINNLKL